MSTRAANIGVHPTSIAVWQLEQHAHTDTAWLRAACATFAIERERLIPPLWALAKEVVP